MTLHIIFASAFIISTLLAIVLSVIDDNNPQKDITIIVFFFVIISTILCFISLLSGFSAHNRLYYRKQHEPTKEDINNGYAEIIRYYNVVNNDTTFFYDIKWIGNQEGEREINNK